MTGRDRIVLIVVIMLAVLGGAWMLVVSPERKQASKLNAQVATAKAALAAAEGQLAGARAAQSQYASAYSSIVNLGKAVPAEQEVPSLIFQLAQASNQQRVDFNSISTGTSATPPASSAASATAATAPAGFSQMPFNFVFDGGFFDLEHLFKQLTAFTTRTPAGALKVSGRLLTIQSVKLAPVETSTANGKKGKRTLSGTITATAYQLPPGQDVTGGATATSPTGASAPASTATGAASSPTAPAIARVTP